MKLAFCLFNYFPYGGLQRDFLRIARVCRERGHDIHVFTMRWEGEMPVDFNVHLVKATGWQNHGRAQSYVKKVKLLLEAADFDLVIGFNKMPHLDLYYAADVCYVARVMEERGKIYKLMPRYREWAALENEVFAAGVKTEILLIAPKQAAAYREFYQTEPERFHLLPPGIDRDRLASNESVDIRRAIRAANQLQEQDIILLMVGSGFKTKGVDRSIRALAALPAALRERCQLWIIGKDEPAAFMTLAKQLAVADRVRFLGAKDDVPNYLLAADLLLHPSYHENTGTVLLEAMASGLAVLTVEACGYAFYVTEANAGCVLPAPFNQAAWEALLLAMLETGSYQTLGSNGHHFAQQADIYSLAVKAADLIESAGKAK